MSETLILVPSLPRLNNVTSCWGESLQCSRATICATCCNGVVRKGAVKITQSNSTFRLVWDAMFCPSRVVLLIYHCRYNRGADWVIDAKNVKKGFCYVFSEVKRAKTAGQLTIPIPESPSKRRPSRTSSVSMGPSFIFFHRDK